MKNILVLLLVCLLLQTVCAATNYNTNNIKSNCNIFNVSVQQIANTAVRVQWTGNVGTNYELRYWKKNGQIKNLDTEYTSALLVQLQPNSSYTVQVKTSNTVCNHSFVLTTSKRNKLLAAIDRLSVNKVSNVRVHVYRPILRNDDIISAQVIWSNITNATIQSYVIRVYYRNGSHIKGSPIEVRQETSLEGSALYGRLEYVNDSINSLHFLLGNNQEYIVQVNGVQPSGNVLPSSEPLLFNTTNIFPAVELFGIIGTAGTSTITGGLITPTTSEPLRETLGLPIALDNRRRRVFYTIGRIVYVTTLSSSGIKEVVFNGTSGEHELLGLTYDWVGDQLYLLTRRGKGLLILRIRLPDRKAQNVLSDNRELLTGQDHIHMTIDPFRGFLHMSNGTIHRFDLRTRTLTVVATEQSPHIIDNVTSSCLYYIGTNNRLKVIPTNNADSNKCRSVNGNVQGGIITADSLGFYTFNSASGQNNPITYYQFNESPIQRTFTEIKSRTSLSLLASTDPGIQPLPKLDCLSPNILNNNRPRVTHRSLTRNNDITIQWTTPQYPPDCTSNIFSLPLVGYRIYLTSNGNPVEGYNGRLVYDNNFTFSNLKAGQQYTVSVSASTPYTVTTPTDRLLRGEPFVIQNATVINHPTLIATTPLATTSSSSSSTSSSKVILGSSSYSSDYVKSTASTVPSIIVVGGTSSPAPVTGPLSDTLIAAISAGALILLLLVLVGVIGGVLIVVCCVKRHHYSKDILQESYNSQRYTREPLTTNTTPANTNTNTNVLIADPSYETTNEQLYSQVKDALPQDYEVPSQTLTNSSSSTSSSSSTPHLYTALVDNSNKSQHLYSQINTSISNNNNTTAIQIPQAYEAPLSSHPSPYSQPLSIKDTPTTNGAHEPTPYADPISLKNNLQAPPTPYTDPVSIRTTPTNLQAPPGNLLQATPTPYADPVSIRTTPTDLQAPPGNLLQATPTPYADPVSIRTTPTNLQAPPGNDVHVLLSSQNSSDGYYIPVGHVPKENPYFVLEQTTPPSKTTPTENPYFVLERNETTPSDHTPSTNNESH